jgi:hypothetical protein
LQKDPLLSASKVPAQVTRHRVLFFFFSLSFRLPSIPLLSETRTSVVDPGTYHNDLCQKFRCPGPPMPADNTCVSRFCFASVAGNSRSLDDPIRLHSIAELIKLMFLSSCAVMPQLLTIGSPSSRDRRVLMYVNSRSTLLYLSFLLVRCIRRCFVKYLAF